MLKKLLKNKLVLLGLLGGVGFWLWKKKQSSAILDDYVPPTPITLEPGTYGVDGVGDYVTQDMLSGMGYDVDSGASAFGAVSRADVAYDDTF